MLVPTIARAHTQSTQWSVVTGPLHHLLCALHWKEFLLLRFCLIILSIYLIARCSFPFSKKFLLFLSFVRNTNILWPCLWREREREGKKNQKRKLKHFVLLNKRSHPYGWRIFASSYLYMLFGWSWAQIKFIILIRTNNAVTL